MIRVMRERRGLSLRALSERCGLSANAISLIERGENSPTVSSLHLLASALEVNISDFFETPQDQTVLLTLPEQRLRSEAGGVVMDSLGIGLQHQQMEPFLITLEPGAGSMEEPVSHPGEEFVYCLTGTVAYNVAGTLYTLKPGTSLIFKASQPHWFRNEGRGKAQLVMIFQAGGVGQLGRRTHMAWAAATGDAEA